MKYLLKKYFIFSFSAHALSVMVSAFTIHGTWKEFLFASFLLMVLFFVIKPLTNIILFPIHLITLNLSSWIFSAGLAYLWIALEPHISVQPWDFPGITIASFTIAPARFSYWISACIISLLLVSIIRLTHLLLD